MELAIVSLASIEPETSVLVNSKLDKSLGNIEAIDKLLEKLLNEKNSRKINWLNILSIREIKNYDLINKKTIGESIFNRKNIELPDTLVTKLGQAKIAVKEGQVTRHVSKT